MSEEYPAERSYSAFWPLAVFLVAFVLLSFYQLYGVLAQRSYFNSQYEKAEPNLPKADEARNRLSALVNDLISISHKDNNALQILREAAQAGIIHQAPSTNAAPAAPAATPAP